MRRLEWMALGAMVVLAFGGVGCGDDDGTTPGTDAGPGGTDAGPGGTDAGPGGTDAGPGGSDAGPGGTDAGPGGTDAGGGDVDAGSAPAGCGTDFAGCTTFTDMTGMGSVTINTGPGFAYTPKCVRVSAGTMVTIQGSITHPLEKAPCSPSGTELDSIVELTGAVTDTTVTFGAAGNYGIYCHNHGAPAGTGMAGQIRVE